MFYFFFFRFNFSFETNFSDTKTLLNKFALRCFLLPPPPQKNKNLYKWDINHI